MDMTHRFYNVPQLIFFVFAGIACTANPCYAIEKQKLSRLSPFTLDALYSFEYAGIAFGKMGVSVTQTADRYSSITDISSSGIARVFVKHDSHSVASGTGNGFDYPERYYESQYRTRKKKKHVRLEYKKHTLTEMFLEPPANYTSRAKIADILLNSAFDPLAAIAMLRPRLYEALVSGSDAFSVRVFDGRRLTDGHFKIEALQELYHDGGMVPVYRLLAYRTLLDGYSSKEQKAAQKEATELYLYFTADERLKLIMVEVPLMIGNLRARLTEECNQPGACLLNNYP